MNTQGHQVSGGPSDPRDRACFHSPAPMAQRKLSTPAVVEQKKNSNIHLSTEPGDLQNPPDPISRLNAALEGRYRIESELGEGGMATVYLADDIKHERKVALKVLSLNSPQSWVPSANRITLWRDRLLEGRVVEEWSTEEKVLSPCRRSYS